MQYQKLASANLKQKKINLCAHYTLPIHCMAFIHWHEINVFFGNITRLQCISNGCGRHIVTGWFLCLPKQGLLQKSSFFLRQMKRYLYNNHINGLVQDCSISSALGMAIIQSCTIPSILRLFRNKYTFQHCHSKFKRVEIYAKSLTRTHRPSIDAHVKRLSLILNN